MAKEEASIGTGASDDETELHAAKHSRHYDLA